MLRMTILMLLFAVVLSPPLYGEMPTGTIEVFHKNRPPALETLERADSVLARFDDEFEIVRHLITDSSTTALIEQYGLPPAHFPFAIVINGRFSAMIDSMKVDFVHFPLCMHGIGRHEGNWSMEHLERVLSDTTLLMDESILPELDEHEETTCPGEESSSPAVPD